MNTQRIDTNGIKLATSSNHSLKSPLEVAVNIYSTSAHYPFAHEFWKLRSTNLFQYARIISTNASRNIQAPNSRPYRNKLVDLIGLLPLREGGAAKY